MATRMVEMKKNKTANRIYLNINRIIGLISFCRDTGCGL